MCSGAGLSVLSGCLSPASFCAFSSSVVISLSRSAYFADHPRINLRVPRIGLVLGEEALHVLPANV
jgi:hypothetical protein